MSIDAKEKARAYILSDVPDIDPVSIGEFIMDDVDIDEVGEDAYDAIVEEIGELIRQAQATVILPGDEVCPACDGTGLPGQSESDGTPADFAAWESGRDEALRAAEAALQRLREDGESDMRSAIWAVRNAIEDLVGEQAETEASA